MSIEKFLNTSQKIKTPDEIKEIEFLSKKIIKYKRAYYEGNPTISDAEYDRLEAKLRNLDPDHPILKFVGTDKAGKVLHDPLMLSANKLPTVEKIIKWAKKWAKDDKIVVGYKIDGLTVKLIYLDGILIQGSTRGDGERGDDITEQARFLKDVPHEIPEKNYCEIRGEAYIPLSTFNSLEGEHKAARNLATGTIRTKDPEKVKERGISFMAFELIIPRKDINMARKIEILNKWGFKSADIKLITSNEIKSVYEDVCDHRLDFDFEMDGLVFKINSAKIQKNMGNTEHHPRWMSALKFPAKQESTIIKEIVWQVGRTGKLTPVANLEPIELAGATISRGTLHNKKFVEEENYATGDKIFLIRSGDVIPKITGMAEKGPHSSVIPSTCPACSAPTQDDDTNVFCSNKNCEERLYRQLRYFIQTVKIEHLGEETLRKLWEKNHVRIPADLYTLERELLHQIIGKNGLKIYKQIQDKKSIPLPTFLKSLGIHQLSTGLAKILAKKFIDFDRITKITVKELKEIEGIGQITADFVVEGFQNKNLYQSLLNNGVIVQSYQTRTNKVVDSPISGKKIYITGSIPGYKKVDLENFVVEKGGIWANLNKSLDLLVLGDKAGPSKIEKASKYGVKTVSWEEFMKIF